MTTEGVVMAYVNGFLLGLGIYTAAYLFKLVLHFGICQ